MNDKEKEIIYLCGPTVYDKVHIGNLRPILIFDIFIRCLKFLNKNKYLFIHNITDIDDKIISRAKQLNISSTDLAKKYTNYYFDALKKLNINSVDEFVSVNKEIDLISDFIKKMIKNQSAYVSDSIYFDTTKFNEYGSISNIKNKDFSLQNSKNLEDKKYFQDFVLWKKDIDNSVKKIENIEGRPGWHSECAAFAYKFTQNQLMIHGGGIDLKFPHHENENIQYLSLTGKPITKKWVHIGIVNLNGKKMSKSENNILTFDQYLKYGNSNDYNTDILRMIFLLSSYKSEIDFNSKIYDATSKQIMSYNKIKNQLIFSGKMDFNIRLDKKEIKILEYISNLNFSSANKEISSMVKEFNKSKNWIIGNKLMIIFDIIGFIFPKKKIKKEYIEIYKEWQEAMNKKNYDIADELRLKLLKKGLV